MSEWELAARFFKKAFAIKHTSADALYGLILAI